MIRNTLRAAAGFTLGLAVYAAAGAAALPPAAQPLRPMPAAAPPAAPSRGLPLAAPIRFSTHYAARLPYVHNRRT